MWGTVQVHVVCLVACDHYYADLKRRKNAKLFMELGRTASKTGSLEARPHQDFLIESSAPVAVPRDAEAQPLPCLH